LCPLHHHRTLCGDPDRFVPEAFYTAGSTSAPRFAYLSFGGGRRIGVERALTEVSLLVPAISAALSAETRAPFRRMPPRDGIRMQLDAPLRCEDRMDGARGIVMTETLFDRSTFHNVAPK
jgi:cytochrome P450